MTEFEPIQTVDDAATQLEATAAVLRAEGVRLSAADAGAIAGNLRGVAGAVEKLPRIEEAATQLEGAAGLIRAHGLTMPADLASQVAANLRATANIVEALGSAG